ncbi:MAG TPA: thioredoxin [Nannocystis exedens]|nr:thioredoxin [Nannocystis exedens]
MRLLGGFFEAATQPLCAALILALNGCSSPTTGPADDHAEAKLATKLATKPTTPEPRLQAPELRSAAAGPVAALIVRELAAARADARKLIIYVGAPWCEPCVAFHDALLAGDLDDALPGTRFLEFNMDEDHKRLAEAGYSSRLIPLFVLPTSDGKAGSKRIEGGMKGPAAVDNLLGRLRPLLRD